MGVALCCATVREGTVGDTESLSGLSHFGLKFLTCVDRKAGNHRSEARNRGRKRNARQTQGAKTPGEHKKGRNTKQEIKHRKYSRQ